MNTVYHAGRLKLEEYLALPLAPLAGRHVKAVSEEVAAFVTARIAPRVYPQGRELLAWHQQQGDLLLLPPPPRRAT